ncbi:MAG: OmpA family protein [Elusimicrobiota bacterium]
MKISLIKIGIGFLCVALLRGFAVAAETDYAAGAAALPLLESAGTARSMAMGSAVVAVPGGAASVLWNPAGLGQMDSDEINFDHNSGLGNIYQETAIFGSPLGEVKNSGKGGSLGGIAASFSYVNYGSFSGSNIAGLPTGNYNAADFSGSVGWGKELLPGLSGGISIKTDHSDLAGQIYDVYATDIGLLWAVIPNLNLGLTYSNLNLGNNVGGSQLISGWRLGAAYTLNKRWILSAQGELQNQAMDRIQMGTEYLIGNLRKKSNVIALRAGYQINYPNPQLGGVQGIADMTGMTVGLGYTITRSLTADYALLPYGGLGISQELSLTFKFGGKKPKHRVMVETETETEMAAASTSTSTLIVVAVKPPPVVFKAIVLGDSYFDFDKSALRPEGMKVLLENIQILKNNPKVMVRVAGYTSMMGSAEYNQLLSERRADAVEQFLVTQGGIAPNRITTIGYGATHPATYEATPGIPNTTAAKSNMRVLFEVIVR